MKKVEESLNLAELVVEKQRLLERIAEIDEILNENGVGRDRMAGSERPKRGFE